MDLIGQKLSIVEPSPDWIVFAGGRLINRGVINVEGTEAKPIENAPDGKKQQPREVKNASMTIQRNGILDNYGCLSIKGQLYCRGTINNYGKYRDIIEASDPDKGTIPYHLGIQVTWKDDVTQDGVKPGELNVGKDVGDTIPADDPELTIPDGGVLNNYGDIVLAPGVFNLYGTLNNTSAPDSTDGYKGHLYLCEVDEAVIPIIPTQEAPNVREKRLYLKTPVLSTLNTSKDSVINNDGVIGEAKVSIISNGVLGNLTPVVYTVKFDTAGGSKIHDQKVESGQKVTKPKNPTKGSSVFEGWFKDAARTIPWDFDNDIVMPNLEEKTITIYAKWQGEPVPVLANKIKITGISHKIAAGKKIRLKVKITPKKATDTKVKWTSSNKKLATVNKDGLVSIKKNAGGKTVIIKAAATDGSKKSATYKIKIMKGQVKKVKIKGTKKSLKAGKSMKLKAAVTTTRKKSVNKKLKWSSSNTAYAAVSKNGKVTVHKAGKGKTVTITARATDGTGKKDSVKIQIK